MNHRSVAYAGKLGAQEAARCIATASGLHGACSEYLARTLGGLREHGIEDPSLCEVERAMSDAPA
jgi:cation transport regulator ChaC